MYGTEKEGQRVARLELQVNTFRRYFKLPALDNLNLLHWSVSRAFRDVLDFVNDLISFHYLTKYHMFAIEPATIDC